MDENWKWDSQRHVYFHSLTNTYAVPDQNNGSWTYTHASEFARVPDSSTRIRRDGKRVRDEEKEDGEIDNDEDQADRKGDKLDRSHVGWGGLMSEDELAAATRQNPCHDRTKQFLSCKPTFENDYGVYPSSSRQTGGSPLFHSPHPVESSTSKRSDSVLRLVVHSSPMLAEGAVIVVDTREEGVQIGRDRCEKGGPPRIRIKEMEVSKTHAVVYWGTSRKGKEHVKDTDGKKESGKGKEGKKVGKSCDEEDDVEGWWIVDLGSTQGTFIGPPCNSPTSGLTPSSSSKKLHRLSKSKHSSIPHPLTHLSTIQMGQTVLVAHIHPSWPCDDCRLDDNNEIPLDDGIPLATSKGPTTSVDDMNYSNPRSALALVDPAVAKALSGRKEMAALRGVLLNDEENGSGGGRRGKGPGIPTTSRDYIDRSAQRRRLHPSSPPSSSRSSKRATPEASSDISSPSVGIGAILTPAAASIGQTILAGQGWVAGSKLGKGGDGLSQPLSVYVRPERSGLGASGSRTQPGVKVGDTAVDVSDWKQRGKMRRFNQLREES